MNTHYAKPFLLLASAALLGACGDDDEPTRAIDPADGMADASSVADTTRFRVEISNIAEAPVASSGVFAVPEDATEPAPIGPGQAYQVAFLAAPGHRLSFATMFVHSNDYFYGPDPEGLELFDDEGEPLQGDITDRISLWNAGTEVDEPLGSGANQAPRQSGPDTGLADSDPTVRRVTDAVVVEDVIAVNLSVTNTNRFTLRIADVSDDSTLDAGEETLAVPLAPGVFAVHGDGYSLYEEGSADRGEGLEALAEDGDPSILAEALVDATGLHTPFAPGVYAVHEDGHPLFDEGEADRGEGLEALAEDGDPSGLHAALEGAVLSSGVFDTPSGADGPGPLLPGDAYVFEIEARVGDRLSFASMLVQSNDLYIGTGEAGIELFDSADRPREGDVTDALALWDAGTEMNEAPGVGIHQAPRQQGPDTGERERAPIAPVEDDFTYPPLTSMIRVTITPDS